MKNGTPPFYLLLTLEAVVRFQSFKRAAIELHLTPSAISHRVRALEKMAGQVFFFKKGNQTVPTESALRLAGAISHTISELDQLWLSLKKEGKEKVFRIWSFPAFATYFLFPNFHEFVEVNQNVSLELSNKDPFEKLRKGLIDAAVYYGVGPFPDFYSFLLRQSSVVPVVSPELFEKIKAGASNVTFLDFSNVNHSWQNAAIDFGFDKVLCSTSIKCDSVGAAFSAAQAGLGLALVPDWLANQGVASGTLVALSQEPIARKSNYWLLFRLGEESMELNREFEIWVRNKV